MSTTWSNDSKLIGQSSILYGDATVLYDTATVNYNGQVITSWTNDTKN